MNLTRALFAISFIVVPALPAATAADCRSPQVLHTMTMVALRDGRFAVPVAFASTPGAIILDSADVSTPPVDGARKSVPVTHTGLEEFTTVGAGYSGIAGSLTQKTVQSLGLTPSATGSRTMSAGGKPEQRVIVEEFSFSGMTPKGAQFLVSFDDSRSADYSGSFSINNFRQFDFDIDFDFPARSARFFSRDRCEGKAVDWTAAPVGSVKFAIDGNGYMRFPVTVDGKKTTALLDTGSYFTTLDFGFANRSLRVAADDPALKKASELPDGRAVYSRPFKSIGFGEVTVADPTLVLIPGITGRSDGPPTGSRVDRDKSGTLPPLVVGMSILRQLRLYIAFDEKMLYFARGEAAAP